MALKKPSFVVGVLPIAGEFLFVNALLRTSSKAEIAAAVGLPFISLSASANIKSTSEKRIMGQL